jgi:hypothetical protein
MTSEKIDLLVKALIKAKGAFKPVEKTKVNPYFKSKYADLGAIMDAVNKPLHDNGITVIQTTDTDALGPVLVTTLAHESGQFISGRYPISAAKADPQAVGSAVTYARRYGLSAILTVVADDDDDGNAATQPKAQPERQQYATPAKSNMATPGPTITEGQGKRLYAIWKKANRQDEEVRSHIKAKYGFNSTKDITRDTYDEICTWVESGQAAFSAESGADAEIEQVPF